MRSYLKTTLTAISCALLLAGCASEPTTATTGAATAAPAPADIALASKLKGQWTGEWSIGSHKGKFTLIVTSVEGNTLKGEGLWYGTASGDTKEALTKAIVINGELQAKQTSGTTFKLKLKNEKTLEGSWDIQGYTGPLTAIRQ